METVDKKIGSVLVVGAGVAGIQASLDMANSGFFVHLVDPSPSIGGIMAQLDKTFPTNDCAMCVISPFLVEVGRHLNVNIISNSELESLEGSAGAFRATVRSDPRYIDQEKCTACGQCRQVCPATAINEFNCGLDRRQAAFIKYPQAVPLAFKIDRDICIGCGMCEKVCLAGAVTYADEPKRQTIDAGAVILAMGNELFDPSGFDIYGYANHPNVVTSLEFERILSASGPYKGHLGRPYDRETPEKIAWLQCVGSRDMNKSGNKYCSSVCCMYSIKQTMIAKEHSDTPLDTAVFYMDMRTYGKEFDKYYHRAKDEHGVRFIRSRIHSVLPGENGDLTLRYCADNGEITQETFNMVVHACGFQPGAGAVDLANRLGISINKHNYARTNDLSPVSTSREGVYVCGSFQGPKDIPQSVMEASAAASEATGSLSRERGKLARIKELPPEKDFSGEDIRIGVFVCNCGINIGGVADVPAVREYARALPNVVHVEDNLFTCSQDTQEKIKEVLVEKKINRVVVASCSPRTHEPLFQETIREAGLNRYLFEMANIRDQNTWVHMKEPEKATEKAKDLVRMAVAKAACIEPLKRVNLAITKAALVVGAGVAGMEAALGTARQGYAVHLVEKGDTPGGTARKLRKTWQGEDIGPYLDQIIQQVEENDLITVHYKTKPTETTGTIGSFVTTLENDKGETQIIKHGATIIATGGKEYKPEGWLYGENPSVLTHTDLDAAMDAGDERVAGADTAVFIQCVGSRIPEREYCSRVCCTHSLKSAVSLKEMNPKMKIYIVYRDIRSYGFREELYRKAREKGIIFIRYDLDNLPELKENEEKKLSLRVNDPILQRRIELSPNILVLASAILPNENRELFELFKVPVNNDGFLVEAHAKLRPVDFASEGLFMAGLCHYPKSMDESIAQARAAVSRAVTILSKEGIPAGGVIASVTPDRCAVCLTCVRTCPYGIPKISEEGYAVIEPAECHGCGVCASECPGKAITLQHFTDDQINAKTDALYRTAV